MIFRAKDIYFNLKINKVERIISSPVTGRWNRI